MNAELINNWNGLVTSDDEVYVLGDFACNDDLSVAEPFIKKLTGELKGNIHLILGNHDSLDIKIYKKYFTSVNHYKALRYYGYTFILSHYPILEWEGYTTGSIHLYGHVHTGDIYAGQKERLNMAYGRHIRAHNMSVEMNNYTPVSINDIVMKSAYYT